MRIHINSAVVLVCIVFKSIYTQTLFNELTETVHRSHVLYIIEYQSREPPTYHPSRYVQSKSMSFPINQKQLVRGVLIVRCPRPWANTYSNGRLTSALSKRLTRSHVIWCRAAIKRTQIVHQAYASRRFRIVLHNETLNVDACA